MHFWIHYLDFTWFTQFYYLWYFNFYVFIITKLFRYTLLIFFKLNIFGTKQTLFLHCIAISEQRMYNWNYMEFVEISLVAYCMMSNFSIYIQYDKKLKKPKSLFSMLKISKYDI